MPVVVHGLKSRSVITKDTQYTISEGTKTLNLADTTQAETDDDALWIGCASIKKQDSLCEVRESINFRQKYPDSIRTPLH